MALRSLVFRTKLQKCMVVPRRGIANTEEEECGASSITADDKETHTGQVFDQKDYRLARFMDKTKLVNPNWAINLIAEVPPAKCKSRVVWCDGGSGPTGHPKVFINLDKPGTHSCNYCGLRFEKEVEEH